RSTRRDRYDRGRMHETREIISVAVLVVACDSILEPKHMCDAEVFAKNVGVILFGESAISFLHFAEQTFFRGEQRSAAVHIEAAAFQHHATAFVLRLPEAAVQLLVRFGDGGSVFVAIRSFRPAVEK